MSDMIVVNKGRLQHLVSGLIENPEEMGELQEASTYDGFCAEVVGILARHAPKSLMEETASCVLATTGKTSPFQDNDLCLEMANAVASFCGGEVSMTGCGMIRVTANDSLPGDGSLSGSVWRYASDAAGKGLGFSPGL